MTHIAPSIIAADLLNLQQQIQKVQGTLYLHVDVMDGHFVPTITIGPLLVKALKGKTNHLLDVHLMVERPEDFLATFIEAGADILTIHGETTPHLHRAVTFIKESGVKAGVALNPHTPISSLLEILPVLDVVLVMSVNPGFSGQTFIPKTMDKVKKLRSIIDVQGLSTLIEVDGGINTMTAQVAVKAGADILVAGSFIFQGDPAQALKILLESLKGE